MLEHNRAGRTAATPPRRSGRARAKPARRPAGARPAAAAPSRRREGAAPRAARCRPMARSRERRRHVTVSQRALLLGETRQQGPTGRRGRQRIGQLFRGRPEEQLPRDPNRKHERQQPGRPLGTQWRRARSCRGAPAARDRPTGRRGPTGRCRPAAGVATGTSRASTPPRPTEAPCSPAGTPADDVYPRPTKRPDPRLRRALVL